MKTPKQFLIDKGYSSYKSFNGGLDLFESLESLLTEYAQELPKQEEREGRAGDKPVCVNCDEEKETHEICIDCLKKIQLLNARLANDEIEDNIMILLDKYLFNGTFDKHKFCIELAKLITPKPDISEEKIDRRKYIRSQATCVFELTKGFTSEFTEEPMKSCMEMAGYVLELTGRDYLLQHSKAGTK